MSIQILNEQNKSNKANTVEIYMIKLIESRQENREM